jgi:hypothetical protein
LTITPLAQFAPLEQHPFNCRNAFTQIFTRFRQLLLHLRLFGVQDLVPNNPSRALARRVDCSPSASSRSVLCPSGPFLVATFEVIHFDQTFEG